MVEGASAGVALRRKIAISFSDLPLEIQLQLRDGLVESRKHDERIRELNEKNNENARVAREIEIAENNRRAAQEADERWTQYLLNLAPHVVAWHEHKKAQRIAKSKRSQEIYVGVASDHGVTTANKVIAPERRPSKIEINADGGRTFYYPRTDTYKKVRKNTKNPVTRTEIADFTF